MTLEKFTFQLVLMATFMADGGGQGGCGMVRCPAATQCSKGRCLPIVAEDKCAERTCIDGSRCRDGECYPLRKPGACPPQGKHDGSCVIECDDDADCATHRLCCATACEGFVCTEPVNMTESCISIPDDNKPPEEPV